MATETHIFELPAEATVRSHVTDITFDWTAQLMCAGVFIAETDVKLTLNIVNTDPTDFELASVFVENVNGKSVTITRKSHPVWFKLFVEECERNFTAFVEKIEEYLQ